MADWTPGVTILLFRLRDIAGSRRAVGMARFRGVTVVVVVVFVQYLS
jgi:hypothetical protein